MHRSTFNPLLLPQRPPTDVDDNGRATLLNPPHLSRLTWDFDSRAERHDSDDSPDWSLLTHPAA